MKPMALSIVELYSAEGKLAMQWLENLSLNWSYKAT